MCSYELHLDGERCWPLADSPFPPSVIRTRTRGQPVRLAFGSCRITLPHEPPYTLSEDRDDRGREVDSLLALVARLRTQAPPEWPDALLLLGDQIYADQVSPETERLIAQRRGSADGSADEPPRGDVADFDMHDDWNTSWEWVRRIRGVPWWQERILGVMSYWIYQHLGNLSPAELAENAPLAEVREAQDAEEILRAFAKRAEEEILERAGATTGTSDAPGCSCWIPVPGASSTRTTARCSRSRSGRGSRTVSHRRLRPPADRDDAAGAAFARSAPPGSVERSGLRRGVGPNGGAAGREDPRGDRPRSTGRRSTRSSFV